MTSSPSSRVAILGLLVALAAAAATPAAAVTVADVDVPDEAEAGTQITATVTLTDLYQDPTWSSWTLNGETELTNVTWTVSYVNPQGETVDRRSYDGQNFSQANISTESSIGTITELRVTVQGRVPAPADSELTYPAEETFVVAEVVQTRGQQGSRNSIDVWEAHHYTAGTSDDPGSREARQALDDARAAIEEARSEGADASAANSTMENAVSAYESGNFGNAVDLADDAEQEANDALQEKRSSDQQTQLLLAGAGVLVLLVLVGGGLWVLSQRGGDDYDKLG